MKPTRAMFAVVIVAVVGILILFVSGYLGRLVGGGMAHPPCETLPSRAEVNQAIEEHSVLAQQISAAGDGIRVLVGTPCEDPDAAVVQVQVSSDAEESLVDEVLTASEGFGVPVVIHRR